MPHDLRNAAVVHRVGQSKLFSGADSHKEKAAFAVPRREMKIGFPHESMDRTLELFPSEVDAISVELSKPVRDKQD